MILIVLFYLAVMVLLIASGWKIFEKAGQPGWASIVPFYNIYIMTKIAGKPAWWLAMFFIPVVNIIYGIWLLNMVVKSFGKDEGFTIGILLLGIVFYPILAFGDARYIGPYGDPAAFKAAQNPQFDFDKPTPAV